MTDDVRFRTKPVVAIASCFAVLAVSFLLQRCSTAPGVVVYTSVDQVFSEPLLRRFEEQTGLRVRAVYDTEETKSRRAQPVDYRSAERRAPLNKDQTAPAPATLRFHLASWVRIRSSNEVAASALVHKPTPPGSGNVLS